MKILENLALLLLSACALSVTASAQNVAIKTNLISDALLNPNIGAEVQLAPQWTAELSGQLNGWTLSHSRKWRHWLIAPEARYWFCRAFAGHHLGLHLQGGQYNVGSLPGGTKFLGTDFSQLRDNRFQGWMGGAGVAYGYTWLLDKHWSLEAELGIGWIYTKYSRYECADCGKKIESNHPHNYFGPDKAALNIVYNF